MSGNNNNNNTSNNDSLFFNGVIIIGAGAAGLTAGYDLHRKGIPIKILEANSRTGGRIKKLEGFANDFPIDVGGEWIQAHPKILKRIVDDPNVDLSDIKTKLYQFSPFSEYKNGKWTMKYSQVDDQNFYRKFINYTWYDFFHDYIASPIQDFIHTDCVVKSIDYSNHTVTVECQDGRTFLGSQVIVTVSLKILQDNDIQFRPPLPEKKRIAIQNATYEPGLKLFMEFTERFYHKDFGIVSKQGRVARGDMYYYDQAYFEDSNQNILAVFIYGDRANRYLSMNHEKEIVRSILNDLDEAFGGGCATRTYVKHYVQNWTNKEPYVRGFYSSYRKGMKPMFEILKPIGNNTVFFAGEALPADGASYGYVHGAALSGRNAARGIANVRCGKKPDMMKNWHARMVLGIATLFRGLEHKLFFHDLDD